MFLKTVMERNQPLVRLGIEWQQNGVILPARVAREARRLAAYYHQHCLQRTQLRFESIQDPADTLSGLVQAAQLFYFII